MSKASEHLRYLAGTLGPRPLGGKSNIQAAEYAERIMAQAGLATERQYFDCMRWEEGIAVLAVDGRPVNAKPAPYAAPVKADGAIVCADTREALFDASLSGAVVVLRGSWTQQPLAPKDNPFWYPDEDRALIERLESCGAAALLIACDEAPMIDDGGFDVPCALISAADAEKLSDGMSARLEMDCVRGIARAFNVVGRLGNAEKRVCVSAHLDTKADAPGALDDGAGSAVVLALAEELAAEELPFAVEFVLFSGEDNFANDGELVFAAQNLSAPERYMYNINIDGVGMRNSDTTVAFFDAPERLKDAALKLMGEGFGEMEPWPQGDHSLFVMRGIPALALTSRDIFTAPLHTPQDDLVAVDTDKTEETVQYLKALLLSQR